MFNIIRPLCNYYFSNKLATFNSVNRLTNLNILLFPISKYFINAPITMNIHHQENFKAIFTSELRELKNIFDKYNYKICLAGGPVRDLLMGLIPEDLDFATCATPPQMKIMFEKEEIRMLNKNGEKHGTITVRINEKQNFEITTLRVDILTDGRHADVAFTKDWCLDANRRDLTINSMFLDLDGNVHDFCGGKKDLDARKVAFVGDPATRIREDYLRILRYFRFYGKIVPLGGDRLDPSVLKIIEENAHGLAHISGERLWTELKRICTCGHHAHSLLSHIVTTGVGQYVGLPNVAIPRGLEELASVCDRSPGPDPPEPITILSALLADLEDLRVFNKRCKVSNHELAVAAFIIGERHKSRTITTKLGEETLGQNSTVSDLTDPELKPYIDMVIDSKSGSRTREKISELLKYQGRSTLLARFDLCDIPKFPVTGHDLLGMGAHKNAKFARTLQKLKDAWKESCYTLTREQLLAQLTLQTDDVS